jgi:hypothetical protein
MSAVRCKAITIAAIHREAPLLPLLSTLTRMQGEFDCTTTRYQTRQLRMRFLLP